MSKRDVFKVLGCEGEPPLRKVTLEGWLQEEDACEYVPGSTVTLEFIGRQMPDPEMTQQAAPERVVNTRETLTNEDVMAAAAAMENLAIQPDEDGMIEIPVPDSDHDGN